MKLIMLAVILFISPACELTVAADNPTIAYSYEVCYEEPPYYEQADSCTEYYGGYCCEWYVYSSNWEICYEEWCSWDDMCGWEYTADNCYSL
jgi:hypothetical protein